MRDRSSSGWPRVGIVGWSWRERGNCTQPAQMLLSQACSGLMVRVESSWLLRLHIFGWRSSARANRKPQRVILPQRLRSDGAREGVCLGSAVRLQGSETEPKCGNRVKNEEFSCYGEKKKPRGRKQRRKPKRRRASVLVYNAGDPSSYVSAI